MRFSRAAIMLMFTALISVGVSSAQWRSTSGSPLPLPAAGARGEIRSTGLIEDGGSFIHITRTTPPDENVSLNDSRLVSELPTSNTSPMTDNNPAAIIFATFNAYQSLVNQTSPFGVYYSGSDWRLYKEDTLVHFTQGAAFNVQVQGTSDNIFVHTPSLLNTCSQGTQIYHPLTNANP